MTDSNNNLPEGWAVATIPEAVGAAGLFSDGDWIESKDQDEDGDVRLIQLADIGDGEYRNRSSRFLTSRKARKLACTFLVAGDILVARMPEPLGRACIFPGDPKPSVTAVDVCIVRPQHHGVDARWLLHTVNSPDFRGAISEYERGTTRKRISRKNLGLIPFGVPPAAEQTRIVAKVEALLARVNAARERLAKVPTLLKRFRQSVLAAACSGQLTADWREARPGIEPARALLARIQSARTEAAETAREKRQIEEAFAEAQLSVSEDEIAVGELPESWLPCRVGAIGTVLNGSTPSRRHPEYWDGNIAWVSSGEVRNNIITETREQITSLGYESTSVKLLPAGTVLLAMIGEGKTRGQAAILRIKATINQNIAAILLSHGLIMPEFLWRWFQFQYEATRVQGGGSGPQALNCQRVRELPFVLPPLDEQREIVRRVEALFARADKVEADVQAATARVEKITQATLSKAFRGELVPTEAELARQEARPYEPASILLERIHAARASAGMTGSGRTPRRRRR